MKLHVLLAAIMLPVALLYFISGALYSLDVKGKVTKQEIKIKLQQPFEPNLLVLSRAAKQTLLEHKLPLPSGEPLLKKKKGVYELRWSDLQLAVTLKPSANPMRAVMTVRQRSLLTQIMRIHRAEAGSAFVFLSVALVVSLLIVFASGVYMGLGIEKFRGMIHKALLSGTLLFFLLLLF